MDFDQWSQDVYGYAKSWYELLVKAVAHPDDLLGNKQAVDDLYAVAWPLAAYISIAVILAVGAFMILAVGKSAERLMTALKAAIIIFVGSMLLREINPIVTQITGNIARSILGPGPYPIPFPNMGKGFWPWLAHGVDLVLVFLLVATMYALVPIIVATGGLLVVSLVLRPLGALGEKQWQIFLSAWLNSHVIAILVMAGFLRWSQSISANTTDLNTPMFAFWALALLANILVFASFYITYAVSTWASGGSLRSDAYIEGGELEEDRSGRRGEPEVGSQTTWQDYDSQHANDDHVSDYETAPSDVTVDGESVSSDGLEISLRGNPSAGNSDPSITGDEDQPALESASTSDSAQSVEWSSEDDQQPERGVPEPVVTVPSRYTDQYPGADGAYSDPIPNWEDDVSDKPYTSPSDPEAERFGHRYQPVDPYPDMEEVSDEPASDQ